jgi:hypothetical protein
LPKCSALDLGRAPQRYVIGSDEKVIHMLLPRFLVYLSVAAVLACAIRDVAAEPNSKQVHFLSPKPKEQFAPGDTIKINLQFEPTLAVTDATAYVQGLGQIEGHVSPTGFSGQYKIPNYCAGALVVDVAVYAGSTNWVFHEDRTVAVRPRDRPLKLKVAQNVRLLDLDSVKYPQQIYVTGTYRAQPIFPPASFERDITMGAAGTKYISSNPSVVLPNADGLCKIFGPGIAVVTAENDGVKDQTVFRIEDGVHPLKPTDLSGKVTFNKSIFRRQRGKIGFWAQEMLYVQDLQITNKSDQLLVGPLYLVINGLPVEAQPTRKVRLINQSGQVGAPKLVNGSPYVRCDLPGDGLTLKPGESLLVTLEFDAPAERNIHYSPALIRASGGI